MGYLKQFGLCGLATIWLLGSGTVNGQNHDGSGEFRPSERGKVDDS